MSQRKFLGIVAKSVGVRVAGVILAFGCQVLLARLLPIESYGAYTYVTQLMLAVAVIVPMGYDRTSVRFLPVWIDQGKRGKLLSFVSSAILVTLVVGSILAVILRAVVETMGRSHESPTWRILADVVAWEVTLVFMGVALLLQQVLRSLHSPVQAQLFDQIGVPILLSAGITILFFVSDFGLQSLLLWQVATYCAAIVGLFIVSSSHFGRPLFSPALIQRQILGGDVGSTARSLCLAGGAAILLARLDLLIAGWFLPPDIVAQYSVAVRISGLMIFGLYAADLVAGPTVSEAWARGDLAALRRTYWMGTMISVSVALPVLVIAFSAPRWLLSWFGPDYHDAAGLLIALVAARGIQSLFGPIGLYLSLTGFHAAYTKILLLVLCLEVVVLPMAIARYAAMGAAVVTGIGVLIWSTSLALAVERLTGIPLFRTIRVSRE